MENFEINGDEDDIEYLCISIFDENNNEKMRLIKDSFSETVEIIDFDQEIVRIYNIPEKSLIIIKNTDDLKGINYNGGLNEAFITEKNYLKNRIINDLKDHITPIEKAIKNQIEKD